MYALGNSSKSPIKMNFKFLPDKSYELVGKVTQPTPLRKFEKVLGIPVTYFENDVEFRQRIKIKGKNGTIRGQFSLCNAAMKSAFHLKTSVLPSKSLVYS
ncbi:hypothetical protein KUH03_02010 [Sphingobacterium sp. E70]|uniref:hypothetical protein n=1 Tax=Sphingobacterium sp. E70 TaxID=2853439 RepID=UPI00211CA2E4|nr:hypothetical protein [Sphingobacterium sp. E70]ULT25793.1 hypothetical protein KUH03_02010 [Sphingobacterium sp. E70]